MGLPSLPAIEAMLTMRPYAREHRPDRGAVREEHAVRVDREDAPPLLVAHVDRAQRAAADARAADEDVETAEL
jgi:hypothetical protein